MIRISAALWVAVMLSGCGPSQPAEDLDAFLARVGAMPAPVLAPVPEAAPYEPFAYSAFRLRSPFAPAPARLAPGGQAPPPSAPDASRPRAYLEGFPLSALRYLGQWESAAGRQALVRDGAGRVHRVPLGAFLGPDHGQVVEVGSRALRLRELIPDGLGGWQYREASLELKAGDNT
jgi:type IV pilus assembly protein PilP